MALTKLRTVEEMNPGRQSWFYTDCYDIVPGATGSSVFNKVVANTAQGLSLLDKHGGQWKMDCANATPAANDMCAIFTLAKAFEFGNGKTFGFRARLDFAEAATNKAMLFFGFSTVVSAGMIVDSTGLPIGTFDGVGMYKPINQTYWSVINSVGSTQTKKDSNGTAYQAAAGSSSTQEVEVHVECLDSTTATATFYVDGNPLIDTSGNILKLTFTYTGAGAMALYLGCKCGAATRETITFHKISFFTGE